MRKLRRFHQHSHQHHKPSKSQWILPVWPTHIGVLSFHCSRKKHNHFLKSIRPPSHHRNLKDHDKGLCVLGSIKTGSRKASKLLTASFGQASSVTVLKSNSSCGWKHLKTKKKHSPHSGYSMSSCSDSKREPVDLILKPWHIACRMPLTQHD